MGPADPSNWKKIPIIFFKAKFLKIVRQFQKCKSSSAQNENLRPLLNRNIPLITGKYGLRNHFWSLESGFLMRKSEKKGPNFLGTLLPIWRLTFLESSCNFRKFGYKRNDGCFFFRLDGSSGPMWAQLHHLVTHSWANWILLHFAIETCMYFLYDEGHLNWKKMAEVKEENTFPFGHCQNYPLSPWTQFGQLFT